MITVDIESIAELHDLAPSQIAEWYAHQLDPTSPLYNISFNHYFFKGINPDVFLKTWQYIVDRHQCFRIQFTYFDSKPKQYLGKKINLDKSIVFIDKTQLNPEEIDAVQDNVAMKYALKPFDFNNEPLFRLHLVAYPNNEYQLIFTIHHIIWDETSTVNLLREFSVIYNAISLNKKPELPSIDYSFLDYVDDENTKIANGNYDRHRDYWLNVFDTVPSPISINNDFTRPPIQSYNGNTVSGWLPKELIYSTQAYLIKQRVSLFVLFMSVLGLYIYRTTKQREFTIGCPLAGRQSKHANILGCFAVPIVLRVTISEDASFEDLLYSIHEQIINGLQHYYYPCYKVIEQHKYQKDLSRPKLFSIMAGVQNEKPDLESMSIADVELYTKQVYAAETHGARFDLTIGLDPIGSDIKLFCTYNTDIYRRDTVVEMLRCLQVLVKEVISSENSPVDSYKLINSAMYQQLVSKFSQSEEVATKNESIIDKIYKIAASNPNDIAIVTNEKQYTYSKLVKTTNIIAANFLNLDLSTGKIIAVMLDPGFDMLVSLLAILTTGCCYLPLSPDCPSSRLEEIASIVDINSIITTSKYLNSFDKIDLKCEILTLEQCQKPITSSTKLPKINLNSLAYIIFTSGSTGKPKGIPIKHASLVNLLTVIQYLYGINREDKILFSTNYTFDASILEIFWPLAYGAAIYIPIDCYAKAPDVTLKTLNDGQISIFQTTPNQLNAICKLLTNEPTKRPKNLRLIICGSSILATSLMHKVKQLFQTRLVNHYGPTEATVDAITFDCDSKFESDYVPIGRPLPNTKVFILDDNDMLVPIGVPGHIVINSPGLTDGYYGDVEKTDKSFFYKNFNHDKLNKIRLYRTGDIGKFDSLGQIHYLGREDQQIKFNGNRIELEEIETKLQHHHAIENAAVLLRTEENKADVLEAYIDLDPRYVNHFSINSAEYSQYTLAQMPWLENEMNAAHYNTWPRYFSGSKILKQYWPNLYLTFPEYQFCILDSLGQVACIGNGIPINLSDDLSANSLSWDDGVSLAFEQHKRGIKPNTILGLSGIVLDKYQGRGLSSVIVQGFKSLAKMHELDNFLGPVRPVGMLFHPNFNVHEWAELKNNQNEPEDFWLRVHTRLGARILGVNPNAQFVEGTIQDWNAWLDTKLPNTNSFNHQTLLQELNIDHDNNHAYYYDPTIWVLHSNLLNYPGINEHITVSDIKDFLIERLPAYMCPQYIEISAKLPQTESGKIDKQKINRTTKAINHKSVKPTNSRQLDLIAYWQKLLAIDEIGINHDFFDLGGQSLQAIQMLSYIHNRYGVKISLQEFYRDPNVDNLDRMISKRAIPLGTEE